MRISSLLILSSLVLLSACARPIQEPGTVQYWQRVSVSDAAYVRGPKAQQMLTRDIGRCVIELRELERLKTVKNAIPADQNGRIYDPDHDAVNINEWDSPERTGDLLAEHTNYVDFYGCMLAKGWERVISLPYDVAEDAHKVYKQSDVNYSRQKGSEYRTNKYRPSRYDDLND